MLRNVVEASGTSIFAIIALVLFVVAFAGVLAVTVFRKQSEIDRQANLPLEDADDAADGILTNDQ